MENLKRSRVPDIIFLRNQQKKFFFHRTVFEKTCPDSFRTILTYYLLLLYYLISAAWPSGLRRYFINHSILEWSVRFPRLPQNFLDFFCYSSSCNEYLGNIYLHYSTTLLMISYGLLPKMYETFFSRRQNIIIYLRKGSL